MDRENKQERFEFRPYTLKELSAFYGTSPYVVTNWLKKHESEIGERIGLYYTIKQVQIIVEIIGVPGSYITIHEEG